MGVGQRDINYRMSLFPVKINGSLDALPNLRVKAFAKILFWNPQLERALFGDKRGAVVRDLCRIAGGIVFLVVSRKTLKERGRVLDRPRKGTYLVEGRGEGGKPVARDKPVRGLHTHNAAKGRRLAYGAPRVGAK